MTASRNDLMVHVEKIVRPLEASGSRKLRMRRELLLHLEAALEEEQARGKNEEEIVRRAKERLGNPGVLREQLQQSVPWLEQAMLREFPAPAVVKRWERKSAKDWMLLSTGQTAMMVMCCASVMLLAIVAVGMITDDDRITFFALRINDPWLFAGKCLIAGTLLIAMMQLVISLMEKAMWERAWSGPVVRRAVAFAAVECAWVVMVNSQLVGHPMGPGEILRGMAAGVGIAVLQVIASRLVMRMGNDVLEWKRLEIAEEAGQSHVIEVGDGFSKWRSA